MPKAGFQTFLFNVSKPDTLDFRKERKYSLETCDKYFTSMFHIRKQKQDLKPRRCVTFAFSINI